MVTGRVTVIMFPSSYVKRYFGITLKFTLIYFIEKDLAAWLPQGLRGYITSCSDYHNGLIRLGDTFL